MSDIEKATAIFDRALETELEKERFEAGRQRQGHRLRRLRKEVEEENG